MFNITVDYQHIHTDVSMTEEQVLKHATKHAAEITDHGKVLVDLKHMSNLCSCELEPKGKGWMVIIYYIQTAEEGTISSI